jgi:hypothetical protein
VAPISDCRPFRIQLEMTRDENPRLYDDLIRFSKGTKRVNRLRFLAHEGLLVQHTTQAHGGPGQAPRDGGDSSLGSSVARHTNQAFDTPPDSEG